MPSFPSSIGAIRRTRRRRRSARPARRRRPRPRPAWTRRRARHRPRTRRAGPSRADAARVRVSGQRRCPAQLRRARATEQVARGVEREQSARRLGARLRADHHEDRRGRHLLDAAVAAVAEAHGLHRRRAVHRRDLGLGHDLDARRALDALDEVVRHRRLQRLAAHDDTHAARQPCSGASRPVRPSCRRRRRSRPRRGSARRPLPSSRGRRRRRGIARRPRPRAPASGRRWP